MSLYLQISLHLTTKSICLYAGVCFLVRAHQDWDGRPPVLMEAMEGIGQGVYLSRLQDKIAEYGVCCVYDRLGTKSGKANFSDNFGR